MSLLPSAFLRRNYPANGAALRAHRSSIRPSTSTRVPLSGTPDLLAIDSPLLARKAYRDEVVHGLEGRLGAPPHQRHVGTGEDETHHRADLGTIHTAYRLMQV